VGETLVRGGTLLSEGARVVFVLHRLPSLVVVGGAYLGCGLYGWLFFR
jgi:hypothetical protein